ncbi:UbiD family decarboxylase [Paenibacillus donghaensis]|uniref:3-octaprenyl-4-hydroxybenzoate carboxy-lyase n=1 Tax=Paenibacillus donghaensis TaxID=414771 RepID=A0A2Z2KEG0_9BACL|nr:UbiD family decarboxylase [Paenibacillus donghaensis]ASA24107.1 3-octaprenyl-4-hydroxybenzoate carboxy-lyase [Paenibacillus donghaensis]
MTAVNIRQLLDRWKHDGKLLRITREVDPKFEFGAVVKAVRGARPLLFERIKGYSVPMTAGLGGSKALLAESMDMTPAELLPRLIDAVVNPLPTRQAASAPVQENVVTTQINLQELFPVCTYHALDSGAYYVSGVMVVKGFDGHKRYTSIRRMQLLEGNRTSILISSPELFQQYRMFEERGEPMEAAFMFGVVPAVVLASQVSTHLFHVDKLDVASALLGQPLEVVRCKTVDLEVLAEAEVVFEGRILPGVRVPEGPFGELGGYYGPRTEQPVVEISAVTYRSQPIWQTILPASYEEKLPMAISREVALISSIRQVVPGVLDVHITMGGVGRYHAVVRIRKVHDGDGKTALLAAFAGDKDLKHVVVVDEDVDLLNPLDVEWAIATRVQADLDLFIVPGAKGSPLEPSHNLRGVTAKMGIDATYPLAEAEHYRRTHIPGQEEIRLEDYV